MAHPAPSESRESASELTGATAPSAARPLVELTALTHHDDFLLELGEVLDGRASVHPAESLDAALEQLSAGRGGQILAIDAREIADVRADVERASTRVPHAVVLAFTEAGAEKTVAAAVKGTAVFAVLPLPMQTDKTSAVLEAALTDAVQRHAAPHASAARPTHHGAPLLRNAPPLPGVSEPPTGGSRKRLWLLIGAGALLTAIGAGVFLIPRHTAAPLPAARPPSAHAPAAARGRIAALPEPAVDTSIVRGRLDDLLVKASRAMFERHFTAPRGANALVYYRSVLAVDPANHEARNGLRRVGHVLISRFQDDIAQGHDNRAALALATLRLAEPTDLHLRPFGIALSGAEVNQALSSGPLGTVPALIAQAARRGVPAAQIAAWQSELSSLRHKHKVNKAVRQITRRIDANRLTGPASAASALARLRTLAPTATATQSAAQGLIAALLSQARHAGLTGDSAAESQWLSAAEQNGATAQAIAAVREQIGAARTSAAHRRLERLLAKARARLDAGALVRPGNDSAAHYLTVIAADRPGPGVAAAASRLRSALASALVTRADFETRAGQRAAAQANLAAARQWGASATSLHAATALAEKPRPPTAAQLAIVAQQLRRIHYVAPAYPQRALSQGISGQVMVQYVVGKSGLTHSLQVISAQPAHLFNSAALDAIRSWRYAPPKFHGEPVSVPVRTMIRFVLPN